MSALYPGAPQPYIFKSLGEILESKFLKISDFQNAKRDVRLPVQENCTLPHYYVSGDVNFLATFRSHLQGRRIQEPDP